MRDDQQAICDAATDTRENVRRIRRTRNDRSDDTTVVFIDPLPSAGHWRDAHQRVAMTLQFIRRARRNFRKPHLVDQVIIPGSCLRLNPFRLKPVGTFASIGSPASCGRFGCLCCCHRAVHFSSSSWRAYCAQGGVFDKNLTSTRCSAPSSTKGTKSLSILTPSTVMPVTAESSPPAITCKTVI